MPAAPCGLGIHKLITSLFRTSTPMSDSTLTQDEREAFEAEAVLGDFPRCMICGDRHEPTALDQLEADAVERTLAGEQNPDDLQAQRYRAMMCPDCLSGFLLRPNRKKKAA